MDNIVHLFPEKEIWNCLILNLKLTIKVIGRERQKCHKPQLESLDGVILLGLGREGGGGSWIH